MSKFFVFIHTILLLSSCSSSQDNRRLGQIIGSTVGAVVGSEYGSGSGKAIFTILGAASGYIIGGELANILSANEQKELNEEIINSLETSPDNSKTLWASEENPSTKVEITPENQYTQENKTCRKYKKTIIQNEKSFSSNATACRDQEGNWILL